MARIAVDMMGSDSGPEELSKGVIRHLKEHKEDTVILYGDEPVLKGLFEQCEFKDRVSIKNTTGMIPMEIKPLDFLRSKNSSMYQAISAVKNGEADAVVSAGSTGGFLTGATIVLRNIEGVLRSGLCVPFPTAIKGKAAVILDVGANNLNTADEIYQFALMGNIYATKLLHYENPTIYTLSNGVEEGKGTDEVVEAYHILKESKLSNYQGNVEARYALDGKHDVIVTGGYAGNIFLKSMEGMASMMNQMIKDSFKRNLFTKIGYLFAANGFKEMKGKMDYRKYGGAILLGINGVAVKAHGNSNAYAFYNALRVSKEMVDAKVVDAIKEEMKN